MLFDFTEEEMKEIKNIRMKYEYELLRLNKELDRLDLGTQFEEWIAVQSEYEKVNDKAMAEEETLKNQFRVEKLKAMENDIDGLAKALKSQITHYIRVQYAIAETGLLAGEDDDIPPERTQALKDMLMGNVEPETLKKNIEEGFKLHLDFIEKLDRGVFRELDAFIDESVNSRPFTKKEDPLVRLEKLDAIIPQNYIMPNNKLANELPKKLSGQFGGFDLDVGRKVLTKVDLNFNDENIIINDKDKKFTQYDRSVYNAICSLLEVGNSNFTPDRVYRCMNGLTDSEYVSPQSIGAITKSIDKARKTYCKIDYTEEMKSRNKNTTQCFIEDFILSAQKVSLEAGGNEVEGYRLNSKPILYQYAQETKQVLTIPIELLNTKEFRKSTPEFTVIKEYLIRQIEWMKTDRNRSNRIIFETLFDEVDIKNPTKDKAKKVRNEMVSPFLESLKSKKYIKGFNFYKEGRSFKGVEILY